MVEIKLKWDNIDGCRDSVSRRIGRCPNNVKRKDIGLNRKVMIGFALGLAIFFVHTTLELTISSDGM
eukprot:CAMPEP_0201556254 /NCGR_PEP_ID=MMETSP0173_2-20130828/54206_1 /ASSEMBLY_ACC=CAM_ASM_000268 /TAXON_ID=218659 /ORGANISM="Vexillifera sp., Strain DIVA3 564/2" /LENGTH=66 /DNA_ID=CAMNT_0047968437 /DNA_START=565 /DNA_END=765 /DNA_ORIENTATION=+